MWEFSLIFLNSVLPKSILSYKVLLPFCGTSMFSSVVSSPSLTIAFVYVLCLLGNSSCFPTNRPFPSVSPSSSFEVPETEYIALNFAFILSFTSPKFLPTTYHTPFHNYMTMRQDNSTIRKCDRITVTGNSEDYWL